METSTETKVDKRTKEYKSSTPTADISKLIELGVPLQMAVFHRTILSYGGNRGGEPETALFAPAPKGKPPTAKPSRTANLWYTPHGIVVEQKGRYKLIPLANCSDTNIL